jgi:type III secretory pathway component EscV
MRSDLGRLAAEILQVGPFLMRQAVRLAAARALGAAAGVMVYCPKMQGYPMRAFSVAAVIMLLASPAFAQIPKLNLLQDKPSQTQEEKDAEAARDKAYRDSLQKIPDAKPQADPWGNVRSADTPKAPAKAAASAKPKTKTGSTAN